MLLQHFGWLVALLGRLWLWLCPSQNSWPLAELISIMGSGWLFLVLIGSGAGVWAPATLPPLC